MKCFSFLHRQQNGNALSTTENQIVEIKLLTLEQVVHQSYFLLLQTTPFLICLLFSLCFWSNISMYIDNLITYNFLYIKNSWDSYNNKTFIEGFTEKTAFWFTWMSGNRLAVIWLPTTMWGIGDCSMIASLASWAKSSRQKMAFWKEKKVK